MARVAAAAYGAYRGEGDHGAPLLLASTRRMPPLQQRIIISCMA